MSAETSIQSWRHARVYELYNTCSMPPPVLYSGRLTLTLAIGLASLFIPIAMWLYARAGNAGTGDTCGTGGANAITYCIHVPLTLNPSQVTLNSTFGNSTSGNTGVVRYAQPLQPLCAQPASPVMFPAAKRRSALETGDLHLLHHMWVRRE